ncbi:MAG: tripartite tricarboxylate transporter substrate binding protein [Betaproteobacteria bacterium]|nr:tripartite tricarboxylate transporter substrate binding protein [Betaproteobacteria bacterium]
MIRHLFAAVVFLFCAALQAQEAYPSRPITMLVPYPPGGVADLTGRPTAFAMGKTLKQRIIVENRAGAGGAIGMAVVASAKPDGHTLLMALSSISIIPEAERLFERKPPYEMNQLAPIALISADPTVLVVRSDSPWKTVKDFVDDAKKRPAKINYGSSGIYGTLHIAMEIFAHAADIKLWHVPYTGGGPAVTALLGGQIEALASGPSAIIGHVKGGKLKVLGSWGDKRLESLRDVPTFKELGYDAEFYIWSGLFAPAGTPPSVMAALRNAARSAVQDPDFRNAMAKIETPINYLDAPEFQKFWDRDAKRLAAAVRRIGRIEDKK